jgi:hypothetical protein
MGRSIAAVCAVAAAVTACTGSGADAPSRAPTSTIPAVAADKALVKKALLTPADLGPPWVQPKKVNKTADSAEGEACKGQPNATEIVKPRAAARIDMTEGSKRGAAIGSFGVRTLRPGSEQAWRNAFAAETAGCARVTASDGTVTTSEEFGAPKVPGSDDVVARVERIYTDKSQQKLVYVRHTYEARIGRVVAYLSYAFIQPTSDPTGGDPTKSVRLLIRQVAKARATFSQ